ncbi:MAG: hypothetical protein DRO11_10390 [Methanobacteriota archaeon]|nr:MAG: hypothetical protein DRO11_10390 [Euryarchaeota archaeon]
MVEVKIAYDDPVFVGKRLFLGDKAVGLEWQSPEEYLGMIELAEDIRRVERVSELRRRLTDPDWVEAEKRFRERILVGRWVPPGVPAPV